MSPNVYFVPVSCRRAADIMREWVAGWAGGISGGVRKAEPAGPAGRCDGGVTACVPPLRPTRVRFILTNTGCFLLNCHFSINSTWHLPTPPAWHVGAAFDGEEGLGFPFILPANWPREKSQQGYVLLSNSVPEQHTVTIGLKGEPPRCAQNCMLANC